MRLVWLCLAAAVLAIAAGQANAQQVSVNLTADRSQIYVAGHQVRFDRLSDASGTLFVAVGDAGLDELLTLVGARLQYQPGTRFVVFTRADGKLVTFTVGSNAATVDDASQAITAAPFTLGDRLYIPLIALSGALGLSTRQFAGGYALSPEIVSVTRSIGQRRTIVQVAATGPLSWHTEYGSDPKKPALVITFQGFSNAAGSRVELGGREAKMAVISQQGPPGYPISSITIDAVHGVKFAVHRTSSVAMDLVLAKDPNDLALRSTPDFGPLVQLGPTQSVPSATPQVAAPSPSATAQPSGLVPTAIPEPEVTEEGSPGASLSPVPLGSGASPSPSSQPIEKVLQVVEADAPGVSRIALTMSGPVTFEWHRLADPDNRFWVDISQAELVGASQTLAVKLQTIRSVTISQNQLVPDHVVRVAIDPTQPVEVDIGAIAGSPNVLGIDITSSTPPPDAPSSGVGYLSGAAPTPEPVAYSTYIPTDPRLIVIDPGHGGNDPGAINESMGLTEKNLTLTIAKRLKADLLHAGWHVTLTRDGDYEVGDPAGNDKQELQARCDVANAAGARLFISVHINASVSSDPNGVTTYFWRDDARQFATDVENAVANGTGVTNAGVIRNNFYVIHHTMMPAILVEVAYLSNQHDAQLLTQQWFLDRAADDIASGVGAFTGGPPR
ncbi:MAG TPA: N-acetylmuramoyl-L-alanine amidase [Candidatus Acidoferrales bacterium]|nr:N-acetylmuramoyl-L-alanine amidase [Candidatus Acidoferrales bacterium]